MPPLLLAVVLKRIGIFWLIRPPKSASFEIPRSVSDPADLFQQLQDTYSHHRGGHFALIVDCLDEWENHLDAHQAVRLDRKNRPDGALQTFVQDPDGHWIELCKVPGVTSAELTADSENPSK